MHPVQRTPLAFLVFFFCFALARAASAGPSDAATACSQMCSCSCPGGTVIPATPAAGRTPDAGTTATTSPQGGATGYHSAYGFYGGYRKSDLNEEAPDFPSAMVHRPLLLPQGMTQPEIAVTFFNDSTNSSSPVRERMLLGFQGSFADGWQGGAAVNVAINPRVTLDSLYVMSQKKLNPFMNARLDAGWRKAACASGAGSFSGGLGLPTKYPFTSSLAIISGRPLFWAFNEDLVTLDGKGCGTTGTIGLPIGLLATLGDSYNLGLRSGYRKLWGAGTGTSFIPVAFDFALVIANQADIGLTLEIPNALGDPTDADKAQSLQFEQRLVVFAQTRL